MELKLTRDVRRYHRETKEILESVLKRNGGEMADLKLVDRLGQPYPDLHFATSHQLGSCRMSYSPQRGVTNSWGQVFGYPGIYVTDGAAIPSSLAVNTSLTILANAERISDGMTRRYKKRIVS